MMSRRKFLPNYHYREVEGKSPLSLQSSVGKPLRNLKIFGSDMGVGDWAKNILPYAYTKSGTVSGVTYTVEEDGGLSVFGTATTGNANFSYVSNLDPMRIEKGQYRIFLTKKVTQPILFRIGKVNEDQSITLLGKFPSGTETTSYVLTFEEDTDIYVNCIVGKGDTVEKETFYLQLEKYTEGDEAVYEKHYEGVKIPVKMNSDEYEIYRSEPLFEGEYEVLGEEWKIASQKGENTLTVSTENPPEKITAQYYV